MNIKSYYYLLFSKYPICFPEMATKFMSYEDTVLHLNAAYFKGYKFYAVTDVDSLIKNIPEETYGGECLPDPPLAKGEKISPQQRGKLPRNCQILNTLDKSKASNIEKFISEHFNRNLVLTNTESQSCLFESILMQLGNLDSMQDENGQQYSAIHLRNQMVAHVAINYDVMYPLLKDHITVPLKSWCYDMLDPNTEGEFACLVLREPLNVSYIYFIKSSFADSMDMT